MGRRWRDALGASAWIVVLAGCASAGGAHGAAPLGAPSLAGVPAGVFGAVAAGVPATSPPGTSTRQSADGSTQAVFDLVLPAAQSASAARIPAYVSTNTASVKIVLTSVNGGAPSSPEAVVAGLTPGSPNCSGAPLVCAVTFATVPVGTDGFTVTLYDQAGAAGDALATNTVTATVGLGAVTTIPLTLLGIISSLSVGVSSGATAGSAGSLGVVVVAFDASGAQIVGSAAYANGPIVLSSDDVLGTLSVPTTSFASPVAANAATVAYTGVAFASGAEHLVASAGTIDASAAIPIAGLTAISATLAGTPLDATFTAGTTNALSLGLQGLATLALAQAGWGAALGHPFAESDGCANVARVTETSGDDWTIAALGAGSCTATFAGGAGKQTQVAVTVAGSSNGGAFQLQGAARR